MNSCYDRTICNGGLIFAHSNNTVNAPFIRSHVLFTYKAGFTRNGILYFYNKHVLRNVNWLHTTAVLNVWTGIVVESFVGPYNMPQRLNGATYRHFVRVARYCRAGDSTKPVVHAWRCASLFSVTPPEFAGRWTSIQLKSLITPEFYRFFPLGP